MLLGFCYTHLNLRCIKENLFKKKYFDSGIYVVMIKLGINFFLILFVSFLYWRHLANYNWDNSREIREVKSYMAMILIHTKIYAIWTFLTPCLKWIFD